MVFDFFGSKKKVIIAMAHIGAMPGSPLYDEKGGMQKLIDGVAADIEKLQAGGVDAIMFGNENDRPYLLKGTPESTAAMTAVVAALKPMIKVPFGVNYLWDPTASVAIAAATGAQFVREIFTGVFASDMGVWAPDAAGVGVDAVNIGHLVAHLVVNEPHEVFALFVPAVGRDEHPARFVERDERGVLENDGRKRHGREDGCAHLPSATVYSRRLKSGGLPQQHRDSRGARRGRSDRLIADERPPITRFSRE